MSTEIKWNGRYQVKRLNNFCCDFEEGVIYDAIIKEPYTQVWWKNGELSSAHYADYNTENPSFEIVKELK